jgi:polyisoprenoid-binding protein YceI
MIKRKHYLKLAVTGACLLLLQSISFYANAQIKASQSNGELTFAGEHAGMSFDGVFEKWQATLVLPPSAQPSIEASFDLGSAKTGDSTYDSTLPEGDWFDVENHPTGTFASDSITVTSGGYKVSGELSLRGKTLPIDFILKRNGDTLSAEFAIDRIDYAIGLDSDPDAEWVSRDIAMTLKIK